VARGLVWQPLLSWMFPRAAPWPPRVSGVPCDVEFNSHSPPHSPSDFRCGKVSSSFESDRGSIINAVGIFDREDELVSTPLWITSFILTRCPSSVAITPAVVYRSMIFMLLSSISKSIMSSSSISLVNNAALFPTPQNNSNNPYALILLPPNSQT